MRTRAQAQAEYNGWKPAEIARRWGVGKDAVYDLIASGKLRAIQVGNRKAVLHEDLAAYEEANETASRRDDEAA